MANFTPAGVELVTKGDKKFFGTMDKANSAVVGFGKSMAKVAVGGAVALGAALVGIGAASIKAAISFESAFAGVIKTTDGLVDEFGNLTTAGEEVQQGFRDLSKEVPTAVEELLAIGELGGQLGIAREGLVDFTRTIAAMGEATNLTTEEAATGFAQLANIMGTPQDQIENMGSSIVALGNNFATTERDILGFAQRIAGAGQIAGLTEDQVFAIGAAFSSVGVQAEAGGTAVQKVLLAMNQAVLEGSGALDIFAATAGMSAEQFAAAWEEDAGLAFQDFVEGLGVAGDDALVILDALELKDQRLTRAFLSLAGAGDLLGETMHVSNQAFDENTALAAEAEARYRTTESQMKILKNTLKDVGITIGQALLPFLNKMLKAAKPLIEEFGKRLPGFLENTLVPAIEGVVSWLGDLWNFVKDKVIPTFEKWGPQILNIASFFSPLVLAIRAFRGDFDSQIGPIADIIKTQIIPAVERFAAWLGEMLPAAIQTASNFWETTLKPALQTMSNSIQAGLIPVIQDLFSWLSVFLPEAFAALEQIYYDVLEPVFLAMVDVWTNDIIPTIMEVATAFGEWLPAAFAAVQQWWEGTLQPTLAGIYDFVKNNVVPAIVELQGWLQQNIPVAFEAVKSVWEAVLRPALSGIWSFINDTLIPIIQSLFRWLNENIPIAYQAVRSAWETTLRPSLEDLWGFVSEQVIPIIESLIAWLSENIPVAYEAAKGAWETVLKPALDGLLGAAEEIVTVVGDVVSWLSENIPAAFGAVQGAWNSVGQPIFDTMKGVIEGLLDVIARVSGALGDLLSFATSVAEAVGDILSLDIGSDTLAPWQVGGGSWRRARLPARRILSKRGEPPGPL